MRWSANTPSPATPRRRAALQSVVAALALGAALWVPTTARAADAGETSEPAAASQAGGPENPCDAAMARAARLGLPAAGDAPDGGELAFRWRLVEHAVSFETDEFDQAKIGSLTTSLVTGTGEYRVRLSLPDHYEGFSVSASGGVRFEGCAPAPGVSPVECTVIGTGRPGCFQLGYRLPPIRSANAGRDTSRDRVELLHLFAGTDAFLSPGGQSRVVFTMPGDYSKAAEEPGGHKLDPLAADLGVETDFAFDPKTEETTLVVANGKAGGSTYNSVGMTLYGHATRRVSAHELMAALQTNGRAVLHINFDVDKATLRPDAMPAVEQVVALLKDDPGLRLEIDGHTDRVGTRQHNQALSEARARTVKAAIVGRGVGADRLATAGFGATKPVADNRTEDGRFKNRRVELVRR